MARTKHGPALASQHGSARRHRSTSTCSPRCPRGRCGATSTRTPTSTGTPPSSRSFDNDERWILPATDPLGRHPWYQAQPRRAADRDRHVAAGQRRQGRSALRVDPDPRPDEVRVLGAQRLPGVPVLPARVGRRVQPHHDVPGDGEPHRRRRARHAADAEVAVSRSSRWWPGRCRSRSGSASSPARSPSTTRRRTCCARASRCTRSWSG